MANINNIVDTICVRAAESNRIAEMDANGKKASGVILSGGGGCGCGGK